ncbi:hypothetical protein L1987_64247 [Smallanthus sonchifolius]|uniref:Uncharacterized protein n=1 Tax=Smallanthus sonchifolius TaxID=185202 RepID=A0ACB9CFW6_9ASTR|nr:hypothetical protein L1987_64247 [Smallanthus sonchifolius]
MEGERKKTVEEQKKLNKKKQIADEEGLEVQQSFMNDVFATKGGLESKAFLLDNLLPGKQIYANVEWMFKRGATKSKRMGAFRKHMVQVVEGYEEKEDMRSYDMVMHPILEKKHFYLICFDTKNPLIRNRQHEEKCVWSER